MRTPAPRLAVLAAGLLAAGLCGAATRARGTDAEPGVRPEVRADVAGSLRRAGRPGLARQWSEAADLEQHGRAIERDRPRDAVESYLEAARRFERVGAERPGLAEAHWRSARAYWMAGETLPVDDTETRIGYFERADVLAGLGIEADPDCAECRLWKFSSMGRLSTARGVWNSVRSVPEMARLLDEAVALAPTRVEDDGDSTLGNVHYTSAIFYRVLPDWFFVGWVLGVKGDKERALSHIRAALALHPGRLDYQIELGAQLLCSGDLRDDRGRVLEGTAVMRAATLQEPETQDDVRELAAARIMVEQPGKACGYTGDTWVEIDRNDALRAGPGAKAAP